MKNLTKRVQKHFGVKLQEAKKIAEETLIDYSAVKGRLENYTDEKWSLKKVILEMDGYNIEDSTFETEYNNLVLTIEYKDNVYSIGNPVSIFVPNNNYLEPLDIDLEY